MEEKEEEEDEEEEGEGRMNERTRRFLARRHPQCKHQTRHKPTQHQHMRSKHCQLDAVGLKEAGSGGCWGSDRGRDGKDWSDVVGTALERHQQQDRDEREEERMGKTEVVATERSKQRRGRCKHNPDFWTLRILDSRI